MSAAGESTPHRPTGATRTAVLDAVRRAEQPITVHEIADRLGLHSNSVRFHLSRLLRAGLVREQPTDPNGPGRPRMVYSAVPAPSAPADSPTAAGPSPVPPPAPTPGPAPVASAPPVPSVLPGVSAPQTTAGAASTGGYELLAEMLAGHLAAASPDPAATAAAVGEAWGRYLADRPVPFSRTTEEGAITQITGILDRLGFTPARDPEEGHRLVLNTCPFRSVADHRPDIVCAIHLGLMRGTLAEMDAPVEVARLDRFEAPYPCISRLRALGGDSPDPRDEDAESDDAVRDLPGWAGRIPG